MPSNYFRSPRCNPDWEDLESVEAKRLRGHGSYSFRKMIISERGEKCQDCGIEQADAKRKIQIFHIHSRQTHRHLSFERSNVLFLCQPCGNKRYRMGRLYQNSQLCISDIQLAAKRDGRPNNSSSCGW